jgi:thioesterase domain-containing protein
MLERGGSGAWSSLVAIQPGGSRPPLFCVHWAGGGVDAYQQLAHCLGPDQPVYGLQAVGLDSRQKPHTRVIDMATHYLEQVQAVDPTGPYYLAGASMGGKVAFEMAQQLRSQGKGVALVALFDTRGPADLKPLQWSARSLLELDNVRGGGAAGTLRHVTWLTMSRVRRLVYATLIRYQIPLPTFMRNVGQTTLLAARNYHPKSYPGKVVFFRATEHGPREPPDPFLGWDRVVLGGLEIHEIPGDHVSMMREPGVRVLAKELMDCLDRAAEGR